MAEKRKLTAPWEGSSSSSDASEIGSRRSELLAPEAMDLHVGARVKARRVQLGISANSVGLAIGVNRQQVDKYEMGRTRISVGRLYAIARFLQTPPGWFFEEYVLGDISASSGPMTMQEMVRSPGLAEIAADYVKLLPEQRRTMREISRCMSVANSVEAASSTRGIGAD